MLARAASARQLHARSRPSVRMASLLSTLLGSAGARKPDAAERSDVGAPSPGYTPAPGREAFTVGGGCFWSVQLAYDREPGVTKTVVGYSQGHTPSPTYEDTCTGRTGHTEVVLVEYDPKVVPFERLVALLWEKIDPTQANGQGGDRGSQYRTGIFYHTEAQRAVAVASREAEEKRLGRTIHTEVFPATQFFEGEGYHQKYLARGGRAGRAQSDAKGCKDPIRCYG